MVQPRAPHTQDELVFPVYLDVPMLISFLAALEGGVSLEDQATSRASRSSAGEKELKARAGLPSILSILTLDMSGKLSSRSEGQSDEEVTAVRRHTEASLFNRLRARLHDANAVRLLDQGVDLGDLQSGDLIEMKGEVIGNPLLQLLRVIVASAPFAGIDIDAVLEGKSRPARRRGKGAGGKDSGGQAVAHTADDELDADGLRLFLTLAGELLSTHVRDVVLRSNGSLSTVMTLASEFVHESTDDYLYESEVRVLGKVTRVVTSDANPINLVRRTTLGLLPLTKVEELIESAKAGFGSDLNVSFGDVHVAAPALQVLPLAIFV